MARAKTDKHPAAKSATTATRAPNNWGLPDWRDAASYGDTKHWTFARWRWEFYRRRDDLRRYFDARAEACFREWQQYADMPGFPRAHLRPDEPGFTVEADEEARAEFGYSGIPNPRIGDQPWDVILPWQSDSAIGIVQAPTPAPDGFRGTFGDLLAFAGVTLTDEQTAMLGHFLDQRPLSINRQEFAVTFDLARPLDPQLKAAGKRLKFEYDKSRKPRQKRRHPDKWLRYLRALDAREAGAPWSEIAGAFYAQGLLDRRKGVAGGYCEPPPHAARDIWNAASVLRFNF